jgi:serine/threonine protein kinase
MHVIHETQMTEDKIKIIIHKALLGIEFIHSLHLHHGHMTPGNIIISDDDATGTNIKITGIGYSGQIPTNS